MGRTEIHNIYMFTARSYLKLKCKVSENCETTAELNISLQGPSQFMQSLPGNVSEVEEGQPLHIECQVNH